MGLSFLDSVHQKEGNFLLWARVVVYSSYASGKTHAGSDLDLAIISPDFGKDRFEEGKMLHRVAWRIDPRIETVPISSESFENDTWIPLIHEIRSNGIEI